MARKPRVGAGTLQVVMVTDQNGDGQPNHGDTITFDIQTVVPQPNVSLTCYQNGHVVYGAVAGFYEGYPWPWTVNMTLSSQTWTGGAADAVAELYYFSGTTKVHVASLNFTVAA